MITEEQIPEIVKSINKGDPKPDGVFPFEKDVNRTGYSFVEFQGLGLYKVNEDPPIRVLTQEELDQF